VSSPNLEALPQALAGHAGYLLVRVGKHAQRMFSLAVDRLGLRPSHCDVLLLLAERGALAQVDIAGTLLIERAHLVALLDQLEARDLVKREADPRDRRRHAVRLTEAGAAVTAEVAALAVQVEGELLGELDPAERTLFREILGRIARDADEGD